MSAGQRGQSLDLRGLADDCLKRRQRPTPQDPGALQASGFWPGVPPVVASVVADGQVFNMAVAAFAARLNVL